MQKELKKSKPNEKEFEKSIVKIKKDVKLTLEDKLNIEDLK